MSNIATRQNEQSSIDQLAAMRALYSRAKILTSIEFLVVVIIVVVLSLIQAVFPSDEMELAIATVSVIAIIFEIIIGNAVASFKERAANIQEAFDTYVLNMEWNEVLCGAKPEFDAVHEYSRIYLKKHDASELQNWYEIEVATVPEEVGKLLCQKTNCTYDKSIRVRYGMIIVYFCLFLTISILIMGLINDLTLKKTLLIVVLPVIPIVQWTYGVICLNKESLASLKNSNDLIKQEINKAKQRENVNKITIRQIQDSIYTNRKNCNLIPNVFYKYCRNKLEKQTHYSVSSLIREINSVA